jgi:hypothetical protein
MSNRIRIILGLSSISRLNTQISLVLSESTTDIGLLSRADTEIEVTTTDVIKRFHREIDLQCPLVGGVLLYQSVCSCARAYLTSRAADRGSYVHDEGSGVTTWHIPHQELGYADFTVRSPGEGAHSPRWTVEHRNNGRTVIHTSHPNWTNARDELMGRI